MSSVEPTPAHGQAQPGGPRSAVSRSLRDSITRTYVCLHPECTHVHLVQPGCHDGNSTDERLQAQSRISHRDRGVHDQGANSGQGALLFHRSLLAVSSTGGLFGASLLRTLTPFRSAPPSRPNHVPKAHLLTPSLWGLVFHT